MFLSELLAPAGNLEKLRVCLLYGADAVYLGGKSHNLRASCEGFSPAELALAVTEANASGARIYYCLNSLAREADLSLLPAQIEEAAMAGVHALIIADPGVLRLARRYAPGLPVHLSTQANTCNSAAAAFWGEQGASRVNLARELSCRDIHTVRGALPEMELEVFVHGAMCLAVSGQCLLSAWLNNRSGNQGRCTQPCRFEYRGLYTEEPGERALVVEEYTRPEEALWRVEKEEAFSSFWAPHDLCLLPWLPWFIGNRVTALKIEGRMKSAGWVAQVVDAYKTALRCLRNEGERDEGILGSFYGMLPGLLAEVLNCATRPLSSGFFLHGRRRNLTEEYLAWSQSPTRQNRSGESLLPESARPLLGRVLEPLGLGLWRVETHGNWRRAVDIEFMLPGMRRPQLTGGSYGLENERGELVSQLGNGTRGVLYADSDDVMPGVFIRKA